MDGLLQFDSTNGIENESGIYSALSWSGLKGTVAWNGLSESEKEAFEEIYLAEDEKGGCE